MAAPTVLATPTPYNGAVDDVHSATVDCSAAGTNKVLYIFIHHDNPDAEISLVTADGNTLTKLDSNVNANVCGMQVYAYPNPDSSVIVEVTIPTFKPLGMTFALVGGAHQSTFYKDIFKAQGFSNVMSASMTPTENDVLILAGINTQGAATLTPVASFTEDQDFDQVDSSIGQCALGHRENTNQSAQTIGWSAGAGGNFRLLALSVKSAAGGVPAVGSVGAFFGS